MCEGHSGTTGLLFLQLITVSSKFVFFLLSFWWSDEQMNKRKDKHRCQTDKELMCVSHFLHLPASSSFFTTTNTLCNTLKIFMSYSPTLFVCVFAHTHKHPDMSSPLFLSSTHTYTHKLGPMFGRRHKFLFSARLR